MSDNPRYTFGALSIAEVLGLFNERGEPDRAKVYRLRSKLRGLVDHGGRELIAKTDELAIVGDSAP
jgi:hypothetical protein